MPILSPPPILLYARSKYFSLPTFAYNKQLVYSIFVMCRRMHGLLRLRMCMHVWDNFLYVCLHDAIVWKILSFYIRVSFIKIIRGSYFYPTQSLDKRGNWILFGGLHLVGALPMPNCQNRHAGTCLYIIVATFLVH